MNRKRAKGSTVCFVAQIIKSIYKIELVQEMFFYYFFFFADRQRDVVPASFVS